MIRTTYILAVTVALMTAGPLAGTAAAQEPEESEKPLDAESMKKKMAEISQLMRESERLLLEMTKANRLVEQQRRIVEQLKKLQQSKPPESSESTTEQDQDAKQEKRKELRERQQKLRDRLEKLFQNQEQAASQTEQMLVKLLRNLPQGGKGPPSQSPRDGEDPGKQPKDSKKKEEQKSNTPKQKLEEDNNPGTKRDREKKKKREEEARLSRYNAWIARLPRAQQERISRGDFSGFPPRYRRLLREYTRLRAEREVERKRDAPPRPR